jgi:uncharacterized protein (DUF2236 family)
MSVAEQLPSAASAGELSTEEIQSRLYDATSGTAVVMLGTANVVMQLARLPIGHGVATSPVESGRVDRHPIKRLRTTVAYLAIAMFGTEEERAAYRREVNRSHRPVHSEPSDEVAYNAFDPELQLWVAACLFVGAEQAMEMVDPGLLAEDGMRDALYGFGARLGTTLQVTDEMWPADRAAFDRYWNQGVEQIEMDELTRTYLRNLAGMRILPPPLRWLIGPAHRFMVAGFLPAPFREELGLSWSLRRGRWHDRVTKLAMFLNRLMPRPIRRFPVNFYLWDTRRRIRTGKPIV